MLGMLSAVVSLKGADELLVFSKLSTHTVR